MTYYNLQYITAFFYFTWAVNIALFVLMLSILWTAKNTTFVDYVWYTPFFMCS